MVNAKVGISQHIVLYCVNARIFPHNHDCNNHSYLFFHYYLSLEPYLIFTLIIFIALNVVYNNVCCIIMYAVSYIMYNRSSVIQTAFLAKSVQISEIVQIAEVHRAPFNYSNRTVIECILMTKYSNRTVKFSVWIIGVFG